MIQGFALQAQAMAAGGKNLYFRTVFEQGLDRAVNKPPASARNYRE